MYAFTSAILREPAPNFAAGLTSFAWQRAPDYARLLEQHRAYAEALRAAGLELELLDALEPFPDAYFVEDVAVVVPELAVVTRPGAQARRDEAEHMVAALAARRPLARLEAPATLDGGDVMIVDREVFVGLSARTNAAGLEALRALLGPHGYRCVGVPVGEGLHLKSSVNFVAPGVLVVSEAFAAEPAFAGFERIVTEPGESYAANVLRINDQVLMAAGFPVLAAALRGRGLELVELDMSEVEKMDGGLSCLSLRM